MKAFDIHSQLQTVDARIIQMEASLSCCEEYRRLCRTRLEALACLRNAVSDADWGLLDDFVCATNAECAFLMQYCYINGRKDEQADLN